MHINMIHIEFCVLNKFLKYYILGFNNIINVYLTLSFTFLDINISIKDFVYAYYCFFNFIHIIHISIQGVFMQS